MKIRLYLVIFIAIISLSCNAKKDSGSGEQGSGSAETPEISAMSVVETPAMPVVVDTAQDAVNAGQTDWPAHFTERKTEYQEALKNWSRASRIPFNEYCIKNIVYGNGRFVATGNFRTNLAYSDDGDTWYAVRPNVFGDKDSAECIVYGNGRFVAAAYGDKIAYSDDGETWTLVEDSHLGDNFIYGIAYGNGCFVAVGFNRSQRNGAIGYSNDGEIWTLVEDGSLGVWCFYCITYGNGQFIAGGYGGKAAYSSDGETWTAMPGSPFGNMAVLRIAYGNGRFVASCKDLLTFVPLVAYSDDGINWTPVSKPLFYRYPIYNIVYANGIFIVVSHNARMIYSPNGETWYPGPDNDAFIIRPLEGTGDDLGGIAYGNGRFVIGCGNSVSNTSRIAWCEFPAVVY